MKLVLTAINAKYIHTNIGIRYFKLICDKIKDCNSKVLEFTINHNLDLILREIMVENPEVIAFSCYIWNIDYIKKLCINIKAINSNIIIIIGGPEVSYEETDNFGWDYLIKGEGENALPSLIKTLAERATPKHNIIEQDMAVDIENLPFPYDFNNENLDNKILYYEASRGCPFNCSYCLSSATRGVRTKSLEKIKAELSIFIEKKVGQVKLTDRTFNADKKLFNEIMVFLRDNNNGVTNFHFEVSADIFDEENLKVLSTLPMGLIQMEIGVQSTNKDTLKEINRSSNLDKLFINVDKINQMENIHLHLDLIAGLPYEDFLSFRNSFNRVYSHNPHQLQLGFLKMLKGSEIYKQKEKHGIVFRDYTPYEVLSTKYLSYDDCLNLKKVEEMVDFYYNSGRFTTIINFLVSGFNTAFDMFLALGEIYYQKQYHLKPLSNNGHYDFLYNFALDNIKDADKILPELCRFDMLRHNPPNKLPIWAFEREVVSRETALNFLTTSDNLIKYIPHLKDMVAKEILRNIHIEIFTNSIITNTSGKEKKYILFDYTKRDVLDKANFLEIII